MAKLECENLLKELSKVARNKDQQKLLEDLSTVSKKSELTPKQKELANKLYKDLRVRLLTAIETKVLHDIVKLSNEYIEEYFYKWKKNETFYPIKDIKEAITNVLNKQNIKENENYTNIMIAYGKEFLI